MSGGNWSAVFPTAVASLADTACVRMAVLERGTGVDGNGRFICKGISFTKKHVFLAHFCSFISDNSHTFQTGSLLREGRCKCHGIASTIIPPAYEECYESFDTLETVLLFSSPLLHDKSILYVHVGVHYLCKSRLNNSGWPGTY